MRCEWFPTGFPGFEVGNGRFCGFFFEAFSFRSACSLGLVVCAGVVNMRRRRQRHQVTERHGRRVLGVWLAAPKKGHAAATFDSFLFAFFFSVFFRGSILFFFVLFSLPTRSDRWGPSSFSLPSRFLLLLLLLLFLLLLLLFFFFFPLIHRPRSVRSFVGLFGSVLGVRLDFYLALNSDPVPPGWLISVSPFRRYRVVPSFSLVSLAAVEGGGARWCLATRWACHRFQVFFLPSFYRVLEWRAG